MILFFLLISSLQYNLVNVADYWIERDSLKEYFYDRLDLSVFYKDLEVGYFLLREIPSEPEKAISISTFNIGFKTEYLSISYGRLYPVFGRGLVLREYIDENFHIDKGITGISLFAEVGDLTFLAISGRPKNALFAERHYYISNDTTDVLRGININFEGKISLGGRYVRLSTKEDPAPYSFSEFFGGNLGFLLGCFDTYLELAKKIAYNPYSGERTRGLGIYTSLSLAFKGLGGLIQYINYDSLALGWGGARYNEPPIINKTGLSINRGNDETGFGISLFISPKYALTINGGFSKTATHNEDKEITERFISVDYMQDIFSGIFSIDYLSQNEIEPGILEKEEITPQIDLTFGSFEVVGKENFVKEDNQNYRESTISLSYTHESLLTFTIIGETRTIKKIDEKTRWLLFEVSGVIGNNHNIVIRYGSEKGGLTCSGGICRYEEPFNGLKVSLITRI